MSKQCMQHSASFWCDGCSQIWNENGTPKKTPNLYSVQTFYNKKEWAGKGDQYVRDKICNNDDDDDGDEHVSDKNCNINDDDDGDEHISDKNCNINDNDDLKMELDVQGLLYM